MSFQYHFNFISMKKKVFNKILLFLFIVVFIIVGYYLDVLIEKKYTNNIPRLFFTIWFIIVIACIEIDRKVGKKRIYSISAIILFIFMQTLIFLIPEFYNFIYNLFK